MIETGNAGPDTLPASGKLLRAGRNDSLRAFAVCLSFANLCFLDVWSRLQSRYFDYFRDRPPERFSMALTLIAATLDIVLLALALWAAWRLARRTSLARSFGPPLFLLLLLVPLNVLRTHYKLFPMEGLLHSPVVLGAAALFCVAVLRWNRQSGAVAAGVVLVLTPLFPIEAGQAAWRIISLRGDALAPRRLAGRLPARPPSPARAVWLIFDELDYCLGFSERPASLQMPEFDRLQSQALGAERVERAQRETLMALPSLITGCIVGNLDVLPPDRLRVKFLHADKPTLLPGPPTVFSRARAAGFNTAIAGWYHPYCRLFGDVLSDCVSAPPESQLFSEEPLPGTPLHLRMGRLFANQLARVPGLIHFGIVPEPSNVFDPGVNRRQQIDEYQEIRSAALRFSADPALGLVFVHWPVPHSFGIYDRKAKRLTDRGADYLDNLALADRTLGELRAAMEKAGVWDSSTVLVSSDHSLRLPENAGFAPFGKPELGSVSPIETPWVPFLLKVPHQDRAVRYASPFNAVVTGDLLLSILDGKVTTPDDAVRWLDERRSRTQ